MLAPWLLIVGFNAVIVDLGANHGVYTVRVLMAAHHLLTSIGIA